MNTTTCDLPGDIRITVPNRLDRLTPYVLLEQGDWFEPEIRFVRQLAHAGGVADVALDIGANLGVYTLTLAQAGAQVWAFEPAAETAELLQASLTDNDARRVTLVRAALSDHAGWATLHTFDQPELNTLNGPGDGPGEPVPLTTLDDAQGAWNQTPIDFVKLDAESEELRVFDGGKAFFARNDPLVMFEIRDAHGLELGLVARLQSLGYAPYTLVPGLNLLVPWDGKAAPDALCINLFACKPTRAAQLAACGLLVQQPEPATPDARALAALLRQPWATSMAARWSALQPSAEPTPPALQAVLLVLTALDASTPAPQRLGALQDAVALLASATTDNDISRACTLARAAAALGQRSLAQVAAQRVVTLARRCPELPPALPFLPPHPEFDAIDGQADWTEWMLCAATRARMAQHHFSSFFDALGYLRLIAPCQGSAFLSPDMARTLSLAQRHVRGEVTLSP
ncbi:MAG: hypothetical protein Fur007_10600 [Rhodoferax sp.]